MGFNSRSNKKGCNPIRLMIIKKKIILLSIKGCKDRFKSCLKEPKMSMLWRSPPTSC